MIFQQGKPCVRKTRIKWKEEEEEEETGVICTDYVQETARQIGRQMVGGK